MSVPRLKSYDVPHKGLRHAISKLILLAGRTSFISEKAVEPLYHQAREAFRMLSMHAHDENEVTLKELEERLPSASHHDMEGHEVIEARQAELEQMLEEIYEAVRQGRNMSEQGHRFYSLLSDFYSMYLQHMSEEESQTQALLWEHFTDEELIGQRTKIMSGMGPENVMMWFRHIIPAQNHEERVGLLTGFKANAPAPAYQAAMTMLKPLLETHEWEMLEAAIEINQLP
jgi:hypothetical protein